MTGPPPPRAEQVLRLADLDRVALAPAVSPLPTVLEAARDVLLDRPPAVLTRAHRQALRLRLHRRALRALAPLAGAPGRPDEVGDPVDGATMEEEVDRLAATDPDALVRSIQRATRAGRPTALWRVVQEDPAPWLHDYAIALRALWPEVEPLWRAAARRLDREVEQLEAAAALHPSSLVVRGLAIPGRVVGDEWFLPSHSDDPGRLRPDARVRLVPVVAHGSVCAWGSDDADLLLAVRYPLRRPRAAPEPPPAPPGSLEALVGAPRAALLLALDAPRSAGELAERLLLVPSGVTHHLTALEAAGLVTRTRAGRRVLVERTTRATALLALYER